MHIDDLSDFYLRLFHAVIEKQDWLPSGPKAIFFLESGEHTWLQVSQGIADAMHKKNLLATNNVESIGLKEAATSITNGNESQAEISLASKYVDYPTPFRFYTKLFFFFFSSRARADFGRNKLGWRTSRGLEDFLAHFDDEVEAMLDELSG